MVSMAVCCVFLQMAASCVSAPQLEKAQFSQRHYTFSVLLHPEDPANSTRLEVALALLRMNYPEEQAEFLNEVLYQSKGIDGYRDWVLTEHREDYRTNLLALERAERRIMTGSNWRYTESIRVKDSSEAGLVIEREHHSYNSGENSLMSMRYYVLDMEDCQWIKIDDLFRDFQGDATRAVIYEELRNYSSLAEGQPLSRGIYLSNEPELSFNFFITQEGIGLHWDPDEIAPISRGCISIILPWRKIRPLLLHEGMELLTKFGIHLFI